ncbi:MAG TPA: DUF1015 family protein, partial [Candidatus Angelobacter sp.]|nr:DUF1015 family protein [Candidatus Angelobacter sp.]
SAVRPIIEPAIAHLPLMSITGEDGDHHTIWPLEGGQRSAQLAEIFNTSTLYIADGHHRYETALNFRNFQRQQHPEAPPDAAFNYVLMLLVDVRDPGLTILPTHRVLHDLAGFDATQLLRRLSEQYRVVPRGSRDDLLAAMQDKRPSPSGGGQGGGSRIGLALPPTSYYTVDIDDGEAADPVSQLDVSVLHREILGRLLGLQQAEVEEERYLSYSRDVEAVLMRVEAGSAQAAFLLRPPAVQDVVEVAQAGQVMPQKSTYFFPKPASGIVFNPLDAAIRIGA